MKMLLRPTSKLGSLSFNIPLILAHRLNQMLNVLWEKTPENVFYEAIRLTEKQWGNMQLVDYTSAESVVLEELRGRLFLLCLVWDLCRFQHLRSYYTGGHL